MSQDANKKPSRQKTRSVVKKFRVRDKDDFEWRNDSPETENIPSLKGFKSVKDKWSVTFFESNQFQDARQAPLETSTSGRFSQDDRVSLSKRADSNSYIRSSSYMQSECQTYMDETQNKAMSRVNSENGDEEMRAHGGTTSQAHNKNSLSPTEESYKTSPEAIDSSSKRANSGDMLDDSSTKKIRNDDSRDSSLVNVQLVTGERKERLGQLDLEEMNSFRDLWLTIRAAFSSQLPKEKLLLIYKDLDNDMIKYSDEPWEFFKRTVSYVLLLPPKL